MTDAEFIEYMDNEENRNATFMVALEKAVAEGKRVTADNLNEYEYRMEKREKKRRGKQEAQTPTMAQIKAILTQEEQQRCKEVTSNGQTIDQEIEYLSKTLMSRRSGGYRLSQETLELESAIITELKAIRDKINAAPAAPISQLYKKLL